MAKSDLDMQELAQRYGWSMAMLNSDPSLKKLFESAVAGNWTPDKFVAELRNTPWYKKNSETARQMAVLKTTDPATYAQRTAQLRASVATMARDMGAPVSSASMAAITEQALTLGWNDDQIRAQLAKYVSFMDPKNKILSGQAGQVEDELRAYARDMGVRMSDKFLMGAVRQVASKAQSVGYFRDQIAQLAISAFPQLEDRLRAGQTVAEIADPYRQAMASILELNPEQIDVWDDTIRSAISGRDKDGKPAMKSLWQFEKDLRKDPRWSKTKGAMNEAASLVRRIGVDFGLVT